MANWEMIGVGAGGFVAGLIGYHLLREPRVSTGLIRLYARGGDKVIVEIYHARSGVYGAVMGAFDPDDDREPVILFEDPAHRFRPQGVAQIANEILTEDGWVPISLWAENAYSKEEKEWESVEEERELEAPVPPLPPPAPAVIMASVLGPDGFPMIDHAVHLWIPETGQAQTARTNHSGNASIEIDPAAGPGPFTLAPSLIDERFEEVWKSQPDRMRVDLRKPLPEKFIFTLTRRAPKREAALKGRRKA